MRISDWSSDVCSSDLCDPVLRRRRASGDHEGGGLEGSALADDDGRIGHVGAGLAVLAHLQHRPRRVVRAAAPGRLAGQQDGVRSEEHTSELQSLMRISYAVFCLKKNI